MTEAAIALLMLIFAVGLGVSNIVYRRLKKAGKNPWLWSILAFVAGAALAFGALYVIALFTFSR